MKDVKSYVRMGKEADESEVKKMFRESGGVVYYEPMIEELSKKTHLAKWICRKVYDAEAAILQDLGIV